MADKKHHDKAPEHMAAPMMCDNLMGSQFELARAYVRIQIYTRQYSPEVGLMRGTIFPELYRPYRPRRMVGSRES